MRAAVWREGDGNTVRGEECTSEIVELIKVYPPKAMSSIAHSSQGAARELLMLGLGRS